MTNSKKQNYVDVKNFTAKVSIIVEEKTQQIKATI